MNKWRQGGLIIRTGRAQDLDAIATLERESFPEDQVSRRSIASFLRSPHMPVIAAFIDGELVGYAILSLRRSSQSVRIYSIAVEADFTRRGVGSALLQASENYARLHKKSQMTLEVRYDNAPAIGLYEKRDFHQFGEHKDYYADGATALRYRKVVGAKGAEANRTTPQALSRKRRLS